MILSRPIRSASSSAHISTPPKWQWPLTRTASGGVSRRRMISRARPSATAVNLADSCPTMPTFICLPSPVPSPARMSVREGEQRCTDPLRSDCARRRSVRSRRSGSRCTNVRALGPRSSVAALATVPTSDQSLPTLLLLRGLDTVLVVQIVLVAGELDHADHLLHHLPALREDLLHPQHQLFCCWSLLRRHILQPGIGRGAAALGQVAFPDCEDELWLAHFHLQLASHLRHVPIARHEPVHHKRRRRALGRALVPAGVDELKEIGRH